MRVLLGSDHLGCAHSGIPGAATYFPETLSHPNHAVAGEPDRTGHRAEMDHYGYPINGGCFNPALTLLLASFRDAIL